MIQTVPAGAWVVGVSGGADSVALLRLLHERDDLQLTAAHLNHETRGDASDGDEQFVRDLCSCLKICCETGRISDVSSQKLSDFSNPSARYRAARFALFEEAVQRHQCQGVILAHHARDQAETVFQRLVRGSGYSGLLGISARAKIGTASVLRPLLRVHPIFLREYLRGIKQTWREDDSNNSDAYQRNVVRKILVLYPSISDSLDDLRRECRTLDRWVKATSPTLDQRFATKQIANINSLLARQAAIAWLTKAGCPAGEIEPAVVDQLLSMAKDAATPSRQMFPGGVLVMRKSGWISHG